MAKPGKVICAYCGHTPHEIGKVCQEITHESYGVLSRPRYCECGSGGVVAQLEYDTSVHPTPGPGAKFDDGKDRYDLVPELAEEMFVKALTYGSKKYSDQGWKHVDNLKARYFAALRRHLKAWRKGEKLDSGPKGSGLPHLAHVMCCVAFLLEDELTNG